MIKRHHIVRFLIGVFGLIFVLCVLLYFSAAIINSEYVKERIHNFLIKHTGAVVRYKDSEINFFPFPEIIFHQVDIAIHDKAAGSSHTDFSEDRSPVPAFLRSIRFRRTVMV